MASESDAYFAGIHVNDTYKAINPAASRVGDFSAFYITIAICSIILGFLLILNIVCCCSRYSEYWLDRHTGNRWLVSIWSTTPHKQPPLDFTELEAPELPQYVHQYHVVHKQEQEPSHLHSFSQQHLASQEYLELHRRESDI
ncbi:hypothetical protein ACJJTC_000691 [Scirpophaga incertulas]